MADPSLRKRATPEKSTSPDRERTPVPSHDQPASHAPAAPTPTPIAKVLLGLVSLSISYYLYHKLSASWPRAAGPPLGESYALCSREGARQIYSVDPESPRPECFLVHGHKFLSSGSLGTCDG